MGEIRDNIKKNIGYYLTLRGISQKEFAEKLGVSQSSVTFWVKGKNSPDIETVARICEILGISISDLFGTDGSDRYSEHEKKIVDHYRTRPELQQAVDILLGLNAEP